MTFSRLTFIIVCFILISTQCLTAQILPGKVILNNMDTMKGTIRKTILYPNVKFWDQSGKKKTYYPDDIKGFIVDEDTFRTFRLIKIEPYKVFMRVIVRGHCTLYEHAVLSPSGANIPGKANVGEDYYLKRKGEKLHYFDWRKMIKGTDHYFLDNTALLFDIRQKKYKQDQVVEIVERYNREYEEKQKEGSD